MRNMCLLLLPTTARASYWATPLGRQHSHCWHLCLYHCFPRGLTWFRYTESKLVSNSIYSKTSKQNLCSTLSLWCTCHLIWVCRMEREKAGLRVKFFLTPPSGGISNRAVYLSKKSLQGTVEPLYLPRPWVPLYAG